MVDIVPDGPSPKAKKTSKVQTSAKAKGFIIYALEHRQQSDSCTDVSLNGLTR
jgi:hypothetical protein